MPASTAQKNQQNMNDNFSRHRRAIDRLWGMAKKAPMFNVKRKGSTGKEYTAYARLVNTPAYKVAVSGACAAVSAELQMDMKDLGMDYTPDSKLRPWAMSVSPGAAFMLEQFLSTIVQQVLYQGRIIRSGIGRHNRNHKEVTKLAIEEVRNSIFAAASSVPSSTTALPMSIAKRTVSGDKKEAKGEEEFEPNAAGDNEEEEEEEEAGDAADDEA